MAAAASGNKPCERAQGKEAGLSLLRHGIKENAANEMHGAIRSPKLLHFTQVNISREYLFTARHGRREIFS